MTFANKHGLERLRFHQIWELLAAGKVRHDEEMIVLDYFISTGLIHPGNEPGLHNVEARLHRRMGLPEMGS